MTSQKFKENSSLLLDKIVILLYSNIPENDILSFEASDCDKGDVKMAENIRIAARFFKDLGNPVRLKILLILLKEEKCLCEILPQFKISQPTMSRHLSVLKEHNLISFRRESNKIIYSIKDKKVVAILKAYGFKTSIV